MNLHYQDLIPADFSPSSRVWIYQSSRLFALSEALEVEDILNEFVASWNAHGDAVKGFATLFFGQFVILMADETSIQVSGCSTDSSVRVIKTLEQKFNVHLFERTTLAFIRDEKVNLLPMAQLGYALQHGFVTADTLYFNNTVLTKKELLEKWIVPVKDSWLAPKLAAAATPS
jgi:hypothetical protein